MRQPKTPSVADVSLSSRTRGSQAFAGLWALSFSVLVCLSPNAWADPPVCTEDGGITTCDYGGEDVYLLQSEVWTDDVHTNIRILTIGEHFTLQAEAGSPLTIEAERIQVAGHLSADEAGGAGGAGGGRGLGGGVPGGDGSGSVGTNTLKCPDSAPDPDYRNSGAGGGGGSGYGGAGGEGGWGADASDDGCQGTGGGAGGADWDGTVGTALGVGGGGGGGSGGNAFGWGADGGRGGGALILRAHTLVVEDVGDVPGRITADGGSGGNGGSSPNFFHGGGGGGGASGGGILISVTYLEGDGLIAARGGPGGNGGAGQISGGDYYQGAGGGGGGGGRIVIERSNSVGWDGRGTVDVSGGAVGQGQNTNIMPPGTPGYPASAGSIGDTLWVDINGVPTADAGNPVYAGEGDPIVFNASASFDPDVDDPPESLTYNWVIIPPAPIDELDNVCFGEALDFGDPEGPTPTLSFPDQYEDPDDDDEIEDPQVVCLEVTDDEGATDRATTYATIFDRAPVVIVELVDRDCPAVLDDCPEEGETFTVTSTDSYANAGAGGPINDDIANREWDWNFVDTFVADATGIDLVEQTRSFDDNGRYLIAVRITDDDLSAAVGTVPIDVINVPPSITSTPDSTANENLPWSYTMTITDPGADTHTYEILSGPTGMTQPGDSNLFEWTPLWEHAEEGVVIVVLAVTDDDLGRTTQPFTITVTPADTDGDGIPDGWENTYGLDPGDPDDALEDPDGDGVSNFDEFERGSRPDVFDGPGAPRLASPPRGYEAAFPVDLMLAVYRAHHPQGFPLTYRFVVYAENPEENPAAAIIVEADGIEAGDITANFGLTADDGFLDNTPYFWRAFAHDGLVYGPPSEVGDFFVNAGQDCPTVPVLLTPLDGGFVAVPDPLFIIQNSIDLDNDTIRYWILLYADEQLQQTVAASGLLDEGEDGTTSWTGASELDDVTEYWWRARAVDGEGCQSEFSPVNSFFTTFENRAPSTPVIVYPQEGESIDEAEPEILVENATDPNHDLISYLFEIDRAQTFDTGDYQFSGEIVQDESFGTTGWQFEAPLEDDTRYYVRVQAFDGELYSDFGHRSFWVNHTNDPPTAPTPLTPAEGVSINNNRPMFTVANATDADGETLLYNFEVYGDEGMTQLAVDRQNYPEGFETTSWRTTNALLSGTYWWRAQAVDSFGVGPFCDLVRFSIVIASDDDNVDDTSQHATGPGAATDEQCGCSACRSAWHSSWAAAMLISLGLIRRRRSKSA